MHSHLHDLAGYDAFQVWIMTFVTTVWFFALGASLGSFLNVIVYRMPLGISLAKQGSRCPNCLTDIRATDNVPIFGWLRLRGRCRACGWTIPARYPLVEALVACEFITLLFVELLSGGTNLPVREPESFKGVVWVVWSMRYPDLLQIYGLHCWLLFFQLAIALIDGDGHATPRRLAIWALAIVVGWQIVFPAANPVPALMPATDVEEALIIVTAWAAEIPQIAAMARCPAGLVCGMLVGGICAFAGGVSGERKRTTVLLSALAGAALGWQSALSIGMMTLAAVGLVVVQERIFRERQTILVPAYIAVFTFGHILCWRLLADVSWWPGAEMSLLRHLIVAAVLTLAACLCRWLIPKNGAQTADRESS